MEQFFSLKIVPRYCGIGHFFKDLVGNFLIVVLHIFHV